MEQIEVDGFRIAYERSGSGPPVVLLHGYVADPRTTWRRQIEDLADEFTVVAWDAPGVGHSSIPSEFLGMAGYADCLAAFVEGLGLGPVHVVGLSFGGALALELCRRHPRIPSTLVLVSAYAGWAGSLPADETDAAAPTSAGSVRALAPALRRRAPAVDVLRIGGAGGCRGVRRLDVGGTPSRIPCDGACVGRRPARCAAGSSCPDPPRLRGPGHAGSDVRGRRPSRGRFPLQRSSS